MGTTDLSLYPRLHRRPRRASPGTVDLFIHLFIPFKGVGFQGGVEDFLTTNGHEWARMWKGRGRQQLSWFFLRSTGRCDLCPGQEGGVAAQSSANRWHPSGMADGVEPGSVTLVGGWGVEPESVTLVGGSLGGRGFRAQ